MTTVQEIQSPKEATSPQVTIFRTISFSSAVTGIRRCQWFLFQLGLHPLKNDKKTQTTHKTIKAHNSKQSTKNKKQPKRPEFSYKVALTEPITDISIHTKC